MPIMDGFEASEVIFKIMADSPDMYPNVETHIVALTSYTEMKTKVRCLEMGMKEVQHKPLNSVELKRVIAYYHHGIDSQRY